jgi:Domain of unknown function (DUF4932)
MRTTTSSRITRKRSVVRATSGSAAATARTASIVRPAESPGISPRRDRAKTYARLVLGVASVGLAALTFAPVPLSLSADAAAVDSAELFAERIEVGVDARVELFAMLERLAGRPEYGVAATPYARAADEWFAPYAGAPAVMSFRELGSSHSIGYDAAMTLAAQLDEQLAPVRPLSPLPEGLDVRWDGVDLDRVLGEVRDFAEEAHFDDLIASQRGYIAAVEEAFRSFVGSRPVRDWFDGVFGPRQRTGYHVVPGLLTGLMNYGVYADANEIYAIMSLEAPDAGGIPTLGLLTEEYLVHEFAHTHVNPVVREHIEVFDGFAPLIDGSASAMEQQHYLTREIVVEESIVRALTVLYLRDAVGLDAARQSLEMQHRLGFTWTHDLALALATAVEAGGGTLTDERMIEVAAGVLMPDLRATDRDSGG